MFQAKPPLAERARPNNLDEFVGQEHLVGKQGVIRKMIEQGALPSIIFWGPPGVGKTTLANIIAHQIRLPFHTLSAVSAGVKEVREVIQRAAHQPNTILFIDEIHRFNKSQQDALLGAVEKGIVTLIGATTENPSFEVNAALLSRCQVYTLKSLEERHLMQLIQNALENDEEMKKKEVVLKEKAALFHFSSGDARRLLNLLGIVIDSLEGDKIEITDEVVKEIAQRNMARYDKSGDQHYDIISAFIKSMRGSDPNAALYWLARMIEAGEDPKFIARRMLILASEDVGLANPTALVMATNCFQAVNMIGYPEAEIILSQTVVYLAASPKSNASYMAIKKARNFVKETGDLPVPLHLRNAPTKLMKEQGYGKGYQYSHDYPNNFSPQEYLPEEVSGTSFYQAGQNPREAELLKRLKFLWNDKYQFEEKS